MGMNIIVENGFAVRIPEIPSRYRANCSKDFGFFVTGETNGLNVLECQQKGLLKGNYVEIAVCWIQNRTLTFLPHYINQEFTEIWGIPVGGEMKAAFPEKASELMTFLIHSQSKDKMCSILESFSRDAFNQWVSEGMQGDPENYAKAKSIEFYFNNIFRFELTKTEGKHGPYHYVATIVRAPQSEVENASLIIARKIYEGQNEGVGYCTDVRLVENEMKCIGTNIETIALPSNNGNEAVAALPEAKTKSKSK